MISNAEPESRNWGIACQARGIVRDQLLELGLSPGAYELLSVVDCADAILESSVFRRSNGVELVCNGLTRFREESSRLDLDGSETSNDWRQELGGYVEIMRDGSISRFNRDRGVRSYSSRSNERSDKVTQETLETDHGISPCRPVKTVEAQKPSASMPSGLRTRWRPKAEVSTN